MKKIIVFGTSGHAKVVAEAIIKMNEFDEAQPKLAFAVHQKNSIETHAFVYSGRMSVPQPVFNTYSKRKQT